MPWCAQGQLVGSPTHPLSHARSISHCGTPSLHGYQLALSLKQSCSSACQMLPFQMWATTPRYKLLLKLSIVLKCPKKEIKKQATTKTPILMFLLDLFRSACSTRKSVEFPTPSSTKKQTSWFKGPWYGGTYVIPETDAGESLVWG